MTCTVFGLNKNSSKYKNISFGTLCKSDYRLLVITVLYMYFIAFSAITHASSHFIEQRVILSASDTDSHAYAVEIL